MTGITDNGRLHRQPALTNVGLTGGGLSMLRIGGWGGRINRK
jgi:hypothetical protein